MGRHSIRLHAYDYTQPGAYFITIVTWQRQMLFGRVNNGVVQVNTYGEVAQQQWEKLPNRFRQVELGEFVIMPNHIHGIIIITDDECRGTAMEFKLRHFWILAVPLPGMWNDLENQCGVPSQP